MVTRNRRLLNLLSPSTNVVLQHDLTVSHVHRSAFCLLSLVLSLSAVPSMAQTQVPVLAPATSASQPGINPKQSPGLTLPTAFSGLDWKTLTPTQQVALKPLASRWQGLSDPQKRKWISLSGNFARMNPGDQAKLHERMAQWAALSPRQREQARLNFAEAQRITPQQKTEKWQAYQALSPEEKQTLAKSVRPKPPRTALAARPVASGKLNQLKLKPGAGPVTIPTALAPAVATSMAPMPIPMPAQTPPSTPEPTPIHESAKP
jgi:hypothetical protein